MNISIKIGIASTGIYEPETKISIKQLIADGLIPAEEAERDAYVSVNQADKNISQSDMAYYAAQQALHGSGLSADDIGLVVFSNMFIKDKTSWSASADICNRLDIKNAEFIDLYQGCNGVINSLDYVACKFIADAELDNALIVSSEKLPCIIADKWNCDTDGYMGDGAGAWLVKRNSKKFKIKNISSAHIPELNDLIYASYGSYEQINSPDVYLYPKKTKETFINENGVMKVQMAFDKATKKVLASVLKESGLSLDDIDSVVFQNLGKKLTEHTCRDINIPLNKTSWEHGSYAGHMGGVDFIHNLHFAKTKPGDNILIIGYGAGVTVMGALIVV